MEQIRIAIAGASGRMGRMLIETTLKTEGAVLVAAFERPDSIFIGRDAGSSAGLRVVWRFPATWPRVLPGQTV
jgi:4-hydroxy-tetrahydrodipicolinate reductase